MRAVLVVALAACSFHPKIQPVGTRVPVAELQRTDQRVFVAREIERGQFARAYFALDALKTRPYLQQVLDHAPIAAKLHDLRPLVGPLIVNTAAGRGLQVVNHPAEPVQNAVDDHAYWTDIERFESRVNALNDYTPGIPYEYAARHGYGVSSAEETGLALSDGEALLSYFIAGGRAYGFLIVAHRLTVHPLGMQAAPLRRATTQLIEAMHDPSTTAWVQPATALYDALIGPFASELAAAHATALFVSPDEFLANLPFAALLEPAGGQRRALVEHYRISYIPSASVYRQLISRPILDEAPRLLAVGNAAYPSGVPALPFAGREATTVSELFPSSLLLSGPDATEARVSARASHYNILHFATHGVLLGDIAVGASSLLVSADADHDGFLNAAEIASLDLSRTYLAVLSACETSVDESHGNLGSITNAFLVAGAPSVIGSLWQVEDEATTLLMLEFYKRFLELGASEALRQAMLELAHQPRTAHPFFWAAFTLTGWDK